MNQNGRISAETLSYGGRRRSFRLFVPARIIPPSPLVVVLAGGGGSGLRAPGFDALAGRLGFLVVYPDGVGPNDGLRSWNDGRPGTFAYEHKVDDVGFIAYLVDDLCRSFPIDRKRVYITGVSDGGMMAYRMACEAADIVAAFAPVAATLTAPKIEPSRPVPLLHIHGTADQVVPFDVSPDIVRTRGYRNTSVRDVVERWAAICGCTSREQTEIVRGVTRVTWRGPKRAEVALVTIAGGGHTWPGGTLGAAQPLAGFAATPAIWSFFQRHALPES